jgi:predicted PurR-regulated permease PerM
MTSLPPEPPEPETIPRWLRLGAALAWRFLLVAAAVFVVALVVGRLRLVFLPLAVAILGATLLTPPARALKRAGLPHALAAAVTLLGAIAVVGGLVALLTPSMLADFEQLDVNVRGGAEEVTRWATDTFGLPEETVERWRRQALEGLEQRAPSIAGGLLGGAYLVLEVLAGIGITVILLFFFLKDGDRLWESVVRLFPLHVQSDVREIGRRSWVSLAGFLRGQTIVAAVDAIGIGIGLWLLGVPLVIPLAIVTFVGAYLPIVGAVVAGFAAAMVALVAKGFTTALLVVGVTTLVQQLESNLLQPVVVGRAVRLHPVAVLLAITAGAILWGVPGAFLAVPVAAVLSRSGEYLADGERTSRLAALRARRARFRAGPQAEPGGGDERAAG